MNLSNLYSTNFSLTSCPVQKEGAGQRAGQMEQQQLKLETLLHNITAMKAEMDRCVQMQLFATFMLIIALYDVAVNVRRYVRTEVQALRRAKPA